LSRAPVAARRAPVRTGDLVGVEEEFLLVDADSGSPAPRVSDVMSEAAALVGCDIQEELHRAQIEDATPPCADLGELAAHLRRLRSQPVEAANRHGTRVVASGTFPGTMGEAGRLITSGRRYRQMAEQNAELTHQQLICGCHVHVSVDDPEDAVVIMSRVRRWLHVLLALSANSPFSEHRDSGFASFRTEVWARWPSAGPVAHFDSATEYRTVLDQLVASGVILDRAMAYWEVRPSDRYPTLEIRIADVMPGVDDVVLLAALARALVRWAAAEGGAPPPLRPELLRAATWRAARSGLTGDLVDPLDGSLRPAAEAVARLLVLLAHPLEEAGDLERVRGLAARLLERGNGAERQRTAFGRRGDMGDVIDAVSLGADGDPAPHAPA